MKEGGDFGGDDDDLGWPTGIEGLQAHELVDELLARGWKMETRRGSVVLVSPGKYDPQHTRRGAR